MVQNQPIVIEKKELRNVPLSTLGTKTAVSLLKIL